VKAQTVGMRLWIPVGLLMSAAAVTLVVASVLHFGVTIPLGPVTVRDPFKGAAIPEAVIATVVAVGGVSMLTRRSASWWLGLGTTLFALLGTGYGLTVTVPRGQLGDIVYHLFLLTLLLAAAGLLLASGGWRAVPESTRFK
jgi:hypothetical protein